MNTDIIQRAWEALTGLLTHAPEAEARALRRALEALVAPEAHSSSAPGAEREMFEAWHYSIDGDSRGDYDDMFCAWQARAALQAPGAVVGQREFVQYAEQMGIRLDALPPIPVGLSDFLEVWIGDGPARDAVIESIRRYARAALGAWQARAALQASEQGRELAEAEETIYQLTRALRKEVEGETFMGEPVIAARHPEANIHGIGPDIGSGPNPHYRAPASESPPETGETEPSRAVQALIGIADEAQAWLVNNCEGEPPRMAIAGLAITVLAIAATPERAALATQERAAPVLNPAVKWPFPVPPARGTHHDG